MPHEVIDQRVIAVYFDKDRRVERLANYGMKDGKVFDFVSRTTPTGGSELQLPELHVQDRRHRQLTRPALTGMHRATAKRARVDARALFDFADRADRDQCASTASSSSATMLVILIIGLTAGPAVSL